MKFRSVDKMNINPNASNFTTYLRNEMLKLNFTGVSVRFKNMLTHFY